MAKNSATINGKEITFKKGMTILEAAEQNGIRIPTLCHKPDLKPSGNCRICVVEIEGAPRLVASCHTPITSDMVILTQSQRVKESRKAALELMMTGHTGSCVTDAFACECKLHLLASELEVGAPRFNVKRTRQYQAEAVSPYVYRDMSKCILCRLCVRACEEIAGQSIYSVAYRGFESKIVVNCDEPLDTEVCKDCGICVEYCPTSALLDPKEVNRIC